MNKAELIEVVASRIDSSKKDAGEAVQAVVEAIQEAVAKGQKVSISGFGVFEQVARPARTYRKPSTGEAIRKAETLVPKFRAGGDFRAFVAGEKSPVAQAVKAAKGAGDEVAAAAEDVVRRVTRKPAAAKAPAKKAASSATAVKQTTSTAAKKTTTAAKKPTTATAAKKAPAKKATTATAAKKAPAKKAPAKKAPAKSAAPEAPTA